MSNLVAEIHELVNNATAGGCGERREFEKCDAKELIALVEPVIRAKVIKEMFGKFNDLTKGMKSTDPEFTKIIDEKFWELF